MGRRGPKPKSPELRLLEGNPGYKSLPPASIDCPSGIPRCPAHIRGAHRVMWKKWGAKLREIGVISTIDAMALELLVNAYQDYLAVRETKNRREIDKAHRILQTTLKEFGLTPASRRNVSAPHLDNKSADPAAKYFA